MNKERLLKSIIGTVAIYGVLVAFLYLINQIFNLGLGDLWIEPVTCAVCSIAAGLLLKGELYAAVWAAGAVIFCAVITVISSFSQGWDFSSFMLMLVFYSAPLLIPFFIAKAVRWSWNNTN